jgi:putative ABC transport system permease protein
MSAFRWLEWLFQDTRFAGRSLRRRLSFTAVVLLTLTLGVGANTSIFSVVKAVLLDPLPYVEASRLVAISETAPVAPDAANIDYTMALALRRWGHSLERVSAFRDGLGILLENGVAEMLRGLSVDYDFFDTLGVQMELGRNFIRRDQQEGRRLSLIISHELWTQRFGADPHILGRVLRLSAFDVTVIGVLPRGFQPLLKATSDIPPQIYYPLPCDPAAISANCQSVRLVGRLRSGVDLGEAAVEANALFQRIERQNPPVHLNGARLTLKPLREVILGRCIAALWIVWAATVFVWLIACANIANLLLGRATSRQPEIALRTAVGASRARIAGQLLTESMLLALGGGGLGVLLALAGTRALASLVTTQIPRAQSAQVDGGVLAYGLTATVVAGLLFGLVPAWYASRTGLSRSIHGGSAFGSVRTAIAVAEIGLAFVLTSGAGLMIQTFGNLMSEGPGYNPHYVLTLTTSVTSRRYSNNRIGYYRNVLDSLHHIRGVESAAFSSLIPMDYTDVAPFYREDRPSQNGNNTPSADRFSVSTQYFRVMRIRLLRGRLFTGQDDEDAPKVVIINQSCARAQFTGEDPIGKHVRLGAGSASWLTVIGIVGDVRQDGIDHPADMQVYMPLDQGAVSGYYRLVARTAGDPMRLERPVRAAFAEIDAESPVYHVKPLEDYLARRLADRKLALALLGLFGVLALLLAGMGVYGVMSYSVALRTREIGIRMALGADRHATMTLVLTQSIKTAAAGVALGMAGTIAMTRWVSGLLYKVRSTDPVTLAVGALLLALVTLTAAAIPARRAAALDPITALHHE